MKKYIMIFMVLVNIVNAQTRLSSSSGKFLDASGSIIINGSMMLIVDTGHNGFQAELSKAITGSLGVGRPLGGDDVIAGWTDIAADGTAALTTNTIFPGSYSIQPGDAVGLVWFSGVTTKNTKLVGGEYYGFYRNTTATGIDAWVVNTYGQSKQYNYSNELYQGVLPAMTAVTSMRVAVVDVAPAIPEPSTYAAIIGGLVFVGAVIRRCKMLKA